MLRGSLQQLASQMARRPDLLCGAVLLSCLLIAAIKLSFSRAKNVVAPARPPVRFFSPHAPVMDLYMGQVEQLERLQASAEISLLFYYAPWCAHSVRARGELQQVARNLSQEVQFIAINCWWNQGRCRKRHNFYQFPVIHLFYKRFGPIEYKGPYNAPYVVRFIRRVITPLIYLPSRTVLQDFLSYHEPGIVGFFEFNASPQPPGYIIFLTSALQALKRDFQGAMRFGVITSKRVAEAISVQQDETIYMHRRFNTSLIFPRAERNFTSENICGWAYENRESVVQWLQFHGGKSRLLEEELSKGPALLLFLPFNPLAPSQSLLGQVMDLAMQYHSCDKSSRAQWVMAEGVNLASPCCCSALLPSTTRILCELCLMPYSSCTFRATRAILESFYLTWHSFAHRAVGCSDFAGSYSLSGHYSACCSTSLPSSPELIPPALPADSNPQTLNITGLRCKTNKTLRFYLLDSHLHWKFAERLGAQRRIDQQLFSAIVNLPDEVHYVLDHRGSLKDTLEHFIKNFSVPYSPLKRHLVGDSSHKFPHSLIREVTTASFLSIVMDPKRDVLLFYYTQWCGFCTVLNHMLIQLAQLFRGNGQFIVARINAAQNDLPWEYMVDRFPVFLLFPRERKHMSMKFPDELPVTLPNLLRFILQHSGLTRRGGSWSGPGRTVLLEGELRRLQAEVEALHQARRQLSRQLSQLWQEKRRLSLHTATLEARNSELRREGLRLEELYREKNQQLLDAVSKLQELADASESLLSENALLKILVASMKERRQGEQEVRQAARLAEAADGRIHEDS